MLRFREIKDVKIVDVDGGWCTIFGIAPPSSSTSHACCLHFSLYDQIIACRPERVGFGSGRSVPARPQVSKPTQSQKTVSRPEWLLRSASQTSGKKVTGVRSQTRWRGISRRAEARSGYAAFGRRQEQQPASKSFVGHTHREQPRYGQAWHEGHRIENSWRDFERGQGSRNSVVATDRAPCGGHREGIRNISADGRRCLPAKELEVSPRC